MADYILSCCSTADLTQERIDKLGVSYIPFHTIMDGVTYSDDLGKSMPYDEFYNRLVNGADATTSQINADEYVDYFKPMLESGKDVIHLCLSSGISGSYNSARIAMEDLSEEFPDRKIYVIDSLAACGGYGMLVDAAADKKAEGLSIDELKDWVEENKLRLNHWFFSTDLTFFVKGGRITKAAGWFGTALNICPLMNVDYQGKLIPRIKVRGKDNVIKKTVETMLERADGGKDYSGKYFINNAACPEDCEKVIELVKKTFPNISEIVVNTIGTTIGAHTGPGTVATFFWGAKRED